MLSGQYRWSWPQETRTTTSKLAEGDDDTDSREACDGNVEVAEGATVGLHHSLRTAHQTG